MQNIMNTKNNINKKIKNEQKCIDRYFFNIYN